MYQSDRAREARDSANLDDLSAVAEEAWAQCAEVAQALWQIRSTPEFERSFGACTGLTCHLAASLLRMKTSDRADPVLQLVVTRAALKPYLTRVEILGWLARDHPDAMVALLRGMSVDVLYGRKPQWKLESRRRKKTSRSDC